MSVLKGYFDDSGHIDDANCSACCIAGYIGPVEHWERFELRWRDALAAHGAPYLHMKEFNKPSSPLYRLRNDEPARAALLSDLVSVIADSQLWAVNTLIRSADLKRLNRERGRNIEIRALAIFGCMTEIYRYYQGDSIEIKVDAFDKASSTIARAIEYAGSHYGDDVSQNLEFSPSHRPAAQLLPMQAADFLAYELKKHHERNSGWFATEKPGLDPDDWERSHKRWLADRGFGWPGWRKSLERLWDAAQVHGGQWDYETLTWLDNVRRGVWSYQDAAARQAS